MSACVVVILSASATLTKIFERYGVPLIVICAVESGIYIILSLIPLLFVIQTTVKSVVPIRIVFPSASPSGKRLETMVGHMIAILSLDV